MKNCFALHSLTMARCTNYAVPEFVQAASGVLLKSSGLEFGDKDSLVVDPTEEKMRDEFDGVEVLHLPMHSVLRVEQVKKKGQAVIRDRESGEKVTPFPVQPGSRSRT